MLFEPDLILISLERELILNVSDLCVLAMATKGNKRNNETKENFLYIRLYRE